MIWREFQRRDVLQALEWAKDEDHVAVHHTGIPYRGNPTVHLFACDELTLRLAARAIGLTHEQIDAWLQHRGVPTGGKLKGFYTTHIDLFGAPLRKALWKCHVT